MEHLNHHLRAEGRAPRYYTPSGSDMNHGGPWSDRPADGNSPVAPSGRDYYGRDASEEYDENRPSMLPATADYQHHDQSQYAARPAISAIPQRADSLSAQNPRGSWIATSSTEHSFPSHTQYSDLVSSQIHGPLSSPHMQTPYSPTRSSSVQYSIKSIGSRNSYENSNTLDPSYRLIKNPLDRKKVFVPGRVFKCLWTQPMGEAVKFKDPRRDPRHSEVFLGGNAFTDIQRFVIVRVDRDQEISFCCPVNTYGSRGTSKQSICHSKHGIIHTPGIQPTRLSTELPFTKEPICMIPTDAREKLRVESRINYGKPTPIDHNIRVKDIGSIHPDTMHRLLQYYDNENNTDFLRQNLLNRGPTTSDRLLERVEGIDDISSSFGRSIPRPSIPLSNNEDDEDKYAHEYGEMYIHEQPTYHAPGRNSSADVADHSRERRVTIDTNPKIKLPMGRSPSHARSATDWGLNKADIGKYGRKKRSD